MKKEQLIKFTTTSDYGDFIKARKLFVPSYQRDYCWKRKNWERFWENITNLVERPSSEVHFIGDLIINKRKNQIAEQENRESTLYYDIVDGHQRLVTFFLILYALLIRIDKEIMNGPKEISKEEVVKYGRILKDIDQLLVIRDFNHIDEKTDLFKDELRIEMINYQETEKIRKLSLSNFSGLRSSPLKGTFTFFSKKIRETVFSPESARKFLSVIQTRVMFNVIKLDDEFTLTEIVNFFQTLNETGESLRSADMFKSFLFEKGASQGSDAEKTVKEKWEEMERRLSNDPSIISNFLYNFLASYFTRNKRLSKTNFHEFGKEKFIQAKLTIWEFLECLDKYSRVYKEIIDPNNFVPRVNSADDQEWKKLLFDAKSYKQLHQVILSIYFCDKLQNSERRRNKLLELLTKYAFRKLTIKKLNPSKELEKQTQNWTLLIKENKWKSIFESEELRDEFDKNGFESKEFYGKMEQQTFENNVLFNIVKKFYLTKCKPGVVGDVETTEHLVPQTLDEEWNKTEWGKMGERQLKKYVNSIGNVTLMKSQWNQKARNKLWSKKIKDKNYLENSWLKYENFGKSLLEKKNEELTPQDIEDRGKELVKEIKKMEIFEFKF